MDALLFSLALGFIEPVAADAAPPVPSTQSVRRSGRATVKIVRPFRLRAGLEVPVEGARWRDTRIGNRDGISRAARLIEFE